MGEIIDFSTRQKIPTAETVTKPEFNDLLAMIAAGNMTLGVIQGVWNEVSDRIRADRPELFRGKRPRNNTACYEIRRIADEYLIGLGIPTPDDFMAEATPYGEVDFRCIVAILPSEDCS